MYIVFKGAIPLPPSTLRENENVMCEFLLEINKVSVCLSIYVLILTDLIGGIGGSLGMATGWRYII